jgi:hypothetical protein
MPRQIRLKRDPLDLRKLAEINLVLHELTAPSMTKGIESLRQPRPLKTMNFGEKRLHEFPIPPHELGQRPLFPSKHLWVFQRALQYEPRDRVQVRSRHITAQPHRL